MNGNKLKSLRENKGLLQKDLADILCIKPSTVGMYEQGRREPDNNMLKKIANYFEVSIDYLLDNNNLNKEEEKVREKEILNNFFKKSGYIENEEELNDNDLNNIIEFIKTNKKYINKS